MQRERYIESTSLLVWEWCLLFVSPDSSCFYWQTGYPNVNPIVSVGRNLRPTLLEPQGVWLGTLASLFYGHSALWLTPAWRLNFEKRDWSQEGEGVFISAPPCASCTFSALWVIKSISDVWRPDRVLFLRLGRAGERRATEIKLCRLF